MKHQELKKQRLKFKELGSQQVLQWDAIKIMHIIFIYLIIR